MSYVDVGSWVLIVGKVGYMSGLSVVSLFGICFVCWTPLQEVCQNFLCLGGYIFLTSSMYKETVSRRSVAASGGSVKRKKVNQRQMAVTSARTVEARKVGVLTPYLYHVQHETTPTWQIQLSAMTLHNR